ncbi:MAG: TrmH family RNA methyltransferase [Erysipelotrichia bacterium]|nr:TrmH family RNA methyltransferase [Erysipelotrichia bacterium]
MDIQLDKASLRKNKLLKKDFIQRKRIPVQIVLDGLSNAYNIGVIIRICEAFCFEAVHLCGKTPSLSSKKIQKTSRKLERWIKIYEGRTTNETLKILKELDYMVLAAELSSDSQEYTRVRYPDKKIALVFGNEKNGISSEVLNLCDQTIHIPLFGMSNSLNVSSAASIMLSHILSTKFNDFFDTENNLESQLG